jgi:hypothetical protein
VKHDPHFQHLHNLVLIISFVLVMNLVVTVTGIDSIGGKFLKVKRLIIGDLDPIHWPHAIPKPGQHVLQSSRAVSRMYRRLYDHDPTEY